MTTTAVKERPILMCGDMVRATLAGDKTHTRRAVKMGQIHFVGTGGKDGPEWNDPRCWGFEDEHGDWALLRATEPSEYQIPCPFGCVGERLWVRENWQQVEQDGATVKPRTELRPSRQGVCYQADGNKCPITYGQVPLKWRPSIHMPRWASRINLEITAVRAERLQEIDALDALAEGVEGTHVITGTLKESGGRERTGEFIEGCPRDGYAQLWDQINGPGAWDLNPWVWVVEFKRIAL